MKTIQLSYPWNDSKLIELKNKVSFLQIGVECPHIFPLEHLIEHNKNWSSEVVVNITTNNSNNSTSNAYTISDKESLEFSDLYVTSLGVSVVKVSNPYIIIDISYE